MVGLQLQQCPCLLVGWGQVARLRYEQLQRAQVRLRLVAPDAPSALPGAADVRQRSYQHGDCAQQQLVFAATDDVRTNGLICAEAREVGAWVWCADAENPRDFTLPFSCSQGPLRLTLSTGGLAPPLAAHVGHLLCEQLHPGWQRLARWLDLWRRRCLTEFCQADYNSQFVATLLASSLPQLLAAAAWDDAAALLEHCGWGRITGRQLAVCLGEGDGA